jgi:hypothetical protein
MEIHTESHCGAGYSAVPQLDQMVGFRAYLAVIQNGVCNEQAQIVTVRNVRDGRPGLYKGFYDSKFRTILNEQRKLPAVGRVVRERLGPTPGSQVN